MKIFTGPGAEELDNDNKNSNAQQKLADQTNVDKVVEKAAARTDEPVVVQGCGENSSGDRVGPPPQAETVPPARTEAPTAAATPTKKSSSLSRFWKGIKKHDKQNDQEDQYQLKVVYTQFGSNAKDVLNVVKEELMPSPEAPDHVVINIQASTVTLDDCLIRRGFDFDVLNPICLPQTPGFDVVGHVACCGNKASDLFEEGDRVAAMVRTGGNARYISVAAEDLVKIPRSIESAEAAAMVSVYTTAYQTLKRIKQNGPMFSLLGKKVLILGGMDGVGQALIHMCTKARADIYATAPKKSHSYIRNVLGAYPLPESKDDWLPIVEGSIDFVFDGLCEDGLETPYQALKDSGELVCYGHKAMLRESHMGILGAPLMAHVNKLWSQTYPRARTLEIWESFKEDPETYKKNLKSLCQLLKWNKIKPHIAKRVTLSEVAEAQSQLESGELRGTVVCLPWNESDW